MRPRPRSTLLSSTLQTRPYPTKEQLTVHIYIATPKYTFRKLATRGVPKDFLVDGLMDPIIAVGFASSILTFIDFSHELISGTFEVIKSGSTSQNIHVSVVINDLLKATEKLSIRPSTQSEHTDALNALASECQKLSEELQKLLEKLKIKANSSKWQSIKVTLRSMWEKGEVAELETRLDKYLRR